jgi:hypothetical protein
MAVDIERISQGLQMFHETWAAIASIVIAVVFLYSEVRTA